MKKNGIAKQYYEDGKLMLEMSLNEDKVSGVMRQYDTQGNLELESVYVDNSKYGVREVVLSKRSD